MANIKKEWRNYILSPREFRNQVEKIKKFDTEKADDLCYTLNQCVFYSIDCRACIMASKTSKELKKQLDAKGYSEQKVIESIELLLLLGG